MKNIVIDFIFVVCLICVIQILFDDYKISKTLFERELDHFEEMVASSQVIETNLILKDETDNSVSLIMKSLSQTCVSVIEYVVIVFSNLISLIL